MEALQKKRSEWERQNLEILQDLIVDIHELLASLIRGLKVAINLFVYLLYGLGCNILEGVLAISAGPQLKLHVSPERPPEEFSPKKWTGYPEGRLF